MFPALRLFCFAAVTAALTCAQDSAVLRGSVVDPSGNAVPQGVVTLTELATGSARGTATDAVGQFELWRLRPGTYRVTVEKTGFKTLVREPVRLLVATPVTLMLALEIGAVTERVVVTAAAAPSVNTTDATMGNPFNEAQVKSLPLLARNPVNLLTLQPGVVFTGDSDTDLLFQGAPGRNIDDREGVVNGVRANQGNVTLDGVDSNDWETQATFTSALPVTLDSLQEFRVVTTNANATDGIAGGAQIALVTKSGSNEFHGNLRWYHRNTATAANAFFNNLAGLARPKLIRNIGGVSVGGPFWRNRTFFFLDTEVRRDRSEATQLRTVPSETFQQGLLRYRTTRGDVATLSPQGFRGLDPVGLGVNQAVLRYLAAYPAGNDQTTGDGLNILGFRFNAPIRTDANLYTARFDQHVTADGRHTVFARGTLGDITTDLRPAQFPGQTAASRLLNDSKGVALGYTAQLGPALINNLRYGLSRQRIEETGVRSERFGLAGTTGGLSDFYPTFRASGRTVPVHDFRNDVSWSHGTHAWQFGGSLRVVRDSRFSENNSYASFLMQQVACAGTCRDMLNTLNADADPTNDPADANRFVDAMLVLSGAITVGNATFLVDPESRTFLPTGTPQARRFAENGFELYTQDSWRVRPSVTLTLGLRYSYYTPVWETSGAMVRPTVNMHEWWNQRQANMVAGLPSDAMAPLAWDLAGRANNRPALYDPDRNNFAPRAALAWSPSFGQGLGRALFGAPGKSAVRAGFGLYYQRIGATLATTADRDGSPGLSTALSSTTGQFSLATAPRFDGACNAAGCNGLPAITTYVTPPSAATFPFLPNRNGSTLGFAVDNRLRTPYSMNGVVSVQRELPGGITLETAYVGTFGRKLPLRLDYAQFAGYLTDPASGQTFWDAQGRIADLIGADPFRPAINPNDRAAVSSIGPVAFFENLMPNLPVFTGNPGLTPTQAFYVYAASRAPGWATMMPGLDVRLTPGNSPWSRGVDPQQDGWVLFHPQIRWMPSLASYGTSNYHSAQFSVRRSVGSALFGLNYVLSKAIDNGSASENGQENSAQVGNRSAGQIANAFRPGADRAVSDFDVRHNLNAHWVLDLPFGRGRRFGNDVGGWDYLIGGWALTGVARWHSGLPISLHNGVPRSTNEVRSYSATLTGPIERDVTRTDPEGFPNLFRDPAAARARLAYTRPGGVGNRNPVYGPRYANTDLGVHKRFPLPWAEGQHRLEFRATAFNAFNNVNFFAEQFSHTASFFSTPDRFGRLTETVGPRGGAREMEFVLRYEF